MVSHNPERRGPRYPGGQRFRIHVIAEPGDRDEMIRLHRLVSRLAQARGFRVELVEELEPATAAAGIGADQSGQAGNLERPEGSNCEDR